MRGCGQRRPNTAFDSTAPRPARIADQLGEEVGRLEGLLSVILSAYGEGARVSVEDVEPFLGNAGGVPPWDFTDAIDGGSTGKALTLMGRMIHGGERHPLQIMAILHGHYGKLARLDGVDARTDNDAAQAMGIKPGYPAKKALGNYQRARRRGSATGDASARQSRPRPAR